MSYDPSTAPPTPTPTVPASMSPPQPVPVIEYDTPRADQVPRRRYAIVFVVAAVLGAMLFGVLGLRLFRAQTVLVNPPPARVAVAPTAPPSAALQQQARDAETQYNEDRLQALLGDALDPKQVVYEEEPVAARRLFGSVCDRHASRANLSATYLNAFEPPVYRTHGFWPNQKPDGRRDALLFSHRLTSPGGNVRLVLMEMDVTLHGKEAGAREYDVRIDRQLNYRICEPKLTVTYPATVRIGTSLKIVQEAAKSVIPIRWVDGTLRASRPKEHNLRFFAGQPDPSDPSHFTLDYELGGVRNTIDGYLTDDDFLRVIPRGGKVEQGNWLIDATK